jgi:hypothetical protein
MNPLWTYFWPVFATGLVLGLISGVIGFHRKRKRTVLIAAVLALAAVLVWHGPLGAADRFRAHVEADAQDALKDLEMTHVTTQLRHSPLARELVLTGPADDWQKGELSRLLGQVPGVHSVSWSDHRSWMPLIIEGGIVTVMGFLFGLLLAYLVELHRRYNAQWNW